MRAAASATETAYDRLRLIVGDEGLERLAASHVVVLGLGGVGSSCAEALARGGIGHFSLVDKDVVSPSNINRQALAFHSTVGCVKTCVMQGMIGDINPDASVHCFHEFIEKDAVDDLFSRIAATSTKPDFVIDCIDAITQKVAVAAWASQNQMPLVSSMGGANKYDPLQLSFADIYQTHICPVARIVRKKCRQVGVKRLTVLYSSEPAQKMPARSDEEWLANGPVLGTMSYLPPIMGQMLASYAIRTLLGIPMH